MAQRLGIFVFAFALMATVGCAVNQSFHYHDLSAPLSYKASGSIAIAVQDQRPYVVSGEKVPEYTGTLRDTIAFDSYTESGEPFAKDVAMSVQASFAAAGFTTEVVEIAPSTSPQDAVAQLTKVKADRYVLVTISDWAHDAFVNVGLTYDVAARVYDADGNPLAENRVNGAETYDGSLLANPAKIGYVKLAEVWEKRFAELFNNISIASALTK
jgi:hypothetical protein